VNGRVSGPVSDDRPLSTREAVGLVAGREIRERLRATSYYLLTGLLVVVILAIGVIARLADDDGPGSVTVGVAGPAAAQLAPLVRQTADALGREATVTAFDDDAAARAALEDGDVDAVVLPESGQVVFEEDVDNELVAILQQAWAGAEIQRALLDAGLTPEQVGDALSTTALEPTTLEGDDADDEALATLTGTLSAILLFISLQTFGGYVLTGVVEEKSSAVVEVLLARVAADQLLAGKVIGIGVAALLQFAAAVVAGVVALMVSGVDVPGDVWSAMPMNVAWFLGGYALYSMLFALAGSLVSRQEDAQAAAAPIMTALIGAYMLVFIFGYVPDSTASRIMSVIPPIAPLLMPMRMAAGAASVVEVVLALVLLVATILGAWKLTGRIYEQVLLRRGSRVSWRDALSLAGRG